jgi:hypothetical protein
MCKQPCRLLLAGVFSGLNFSSEESGSVFTWTRRMRWAGHVVRMRKRGTRIGYWWENQKEKRQTGRLRHRSADYIKMNLGEAGWGVVARISMAQNRYKRRALDNSVLNLRIPQDAGKLSSGYTTVGLSSSAQLLRVSLLQGIIPQNTEPILHISCWITVAVCLRDKNSGKHKYTYMVHRANVRSFQVNCDVFFLWNT